MKVDFKLENDNVWRAYIKVVACHVWDINPEEWDHYYKHQPEEWVPIATNRRKELCIRDAKKYVSKIPKHYLKDQRRNSK